MNIQYAQHHEEREILNYIVKKRYFFRVKGNAIWKDMENKKVCGSRTWQSMKERYLNHIIPKIGQFNLTPEKKNKVLTPFSSNVKISHDVFEEATTSNSNIETNEGESVEDHNESKFGESSLDKGTKQTGKRKNDNEELENKQLNSEPVSSASCGDNTHESKISESPANDKNPSEQIIKEPTTNEEVQNVPKDSSSNKVIEELISIWDLSEPETRPDEPHFDSRQDISKSFPTYDTGQDKSYHEKIPNNEECSDDIRSTQTFGAQENVECLDEIGRTQEFEPEEVQNNEECSGNLGSTQRFEAQNNEVCLDDIEKTQEFEPEEIHNNEERSGNLGSTQRCEAQNNEVCLDDIGKTQEFEPKVYNCVVNLGTKINGASFQAQKFNHNHSNLQRSSPKKNSKQQKELIEGLNVSHEADNDDINTSNETVIFESSSVHETSRRYSPSGNSSNEIPLQINKSSQTPMKQKRKKLNTSSNMESHSLAKKKRFVKEREIDISNKKKKPIKPKISKEKSSNSLHRHNESKRRNATNTFSSSSSDDDSYVLSSDSEDDIVPKSKRVKNYTEVEDKLILDYIYKHNLIRSVKGKTMWVDLENKKLLPGIGRWHSLKERFRKRILPRLHKYNINERVIEKFERFQTSAETETKPPLKYSKQEDFLILEFIIKFRRYKENIAPNIERYKISDEAIERFTKALKKKRRPANFKKYQIPRKSRTKKSSSRQNTTSKLNYTSLSDDSSSAQSSQPSNTVSNDLSYVFDTEESSSSEDVNKSVKKVNESTSRNEMLTKHPPKGSESSSRKNSQNPKQDKNVSKVAENCESNIQENPENVLKRTTVMKRKLFTKNLIENLYEKTPHYSGSKKDLFSRKNKKLVNDIHSQADELIGENQRSLPEEEVNAVNIHAQDEELDDENQRSPPEEKLNVYIFGPLS
ncbi:hypothetical protein Anas_02683 [Armadillidium nasatum]|uniref:Telomeric repeat-binding factor 2-interacting protein 1 n=1 Tax=Armadillidium nasatum TaxID=96803 RepID=A0A5N5SY21_9CRUS|nr:hypothetical protein Anas_02683 [Armadillidium nasatum]